MALTALDLGLLIFGANHFIPLGLVWSIVMVGFGAILFALRMRYEPLTPAWLAHFLFNVQPLLLFPLIDQFAPATLVRAVLRPAIREAEFDDR
jgi:hypothetical protein